MISKSNLIILLPKSVKHWLRLVLMFTRRLISVLHQTIDLTTICATTPSWVLSVLKPFDTSLILICCTKNRIKLDGDSVESNTLIKSIKSSKYSTKTIYFFYDEHHLPTFSLLMMLCRWRPSTIVFSSYNQYSSKHPMTNIFRLLKKKRCKIVTIWWDTCSKSFFQKNKTPMILSNLNVILDNPSGVFLEKARKQLQGRLMFLYPPVVFQDQFKKEPNRDIDVFFCGSMGSYRSHRKDLFSQLEHLELNIEFLSAEKEKLKYREYMEKLRRSKIGISLPESVDCDQLKARVFEILVSGAHLLDRKNSQTTEYFIDGEDFTSFNHSEELPMLINDILTSLSKSTDKIEKGTKKARKLCKPNTFWEHILS